MSIEFNSQQNEKHNLTLSQRQIELEAGYLGRIFGNAKTVPTNICGMVLFILLITSVGVCFYPAKIEAQDYLKLILPVVTGILGYFFGKSC